MHMVFHMVIHVPMHEEGEGVDLYRAAAQSEVGNVGLQPRVLWNRHQPS